MTHYTRETWPSDRWPDFSFDEFRSPDVDYAAVHVDFMDRLQILRRQFNQPMIVTSGYRTPEHNAEVSTTGRDGPHTHGRAVDIAIHGADARDLIGMAISHGFTGIGIKQTGPYSGRFVHLDDLGDGFAGPRPWVWTYG